MKTVSCKLISSEPISLSKAAKILSKFTTVTNGASPAISAYVSRASDAFDELAHFHNNLNRTPKSSKHRESKDPNYVSSVQPSQALSSDLDGESNRVKKGKKDKKKKVAEEGEEKEGSVVKEEEQEERENEDSGKKKKKKAKKRKSGGDGEGSLGIEIKEEDERGKKRKSEEIEERRWDGESDETRSSKKVKKRRSLSES